jgi:cytochrome P450
VTETAFDRNQLDVDLTESGLYANGFPHEVFTALRRDAPVKWQSFPDGFKGDHDEGFWVLSKHADIQAASHNPELFSAFDGPQLSHQPGIAGTMLVSMGGPDHRRQRRLISAGFTPRMVAQLESQIWRWAVSIVDRALERGECDFVSEIAYKLPMNVIADIVGIPVQDRDVLFSLANDMLQGDAPERRISQEEYLGIQVEMFEYAQKLGREKRANPQDDVWTILSTVEVETGGGEHTALSEIELDMFFLLLIIAGSETTRNAVALDLAPVAVGESFSWRNPVSTPRNSGVWLSALWRSMTIPIPIATVAYARHGTFRHCPTWISPRGRG